MNYNVFTVNELKRATMDDGKNVVDILLYEIREIRKEVHDLKETVTTLKVKIGVASGFFGVIGGVVVKVLEYISKSKGN